jgi:hypothetical protein
MKKYNHVERTKKVAPMAPVIKTGLGIGLLASGLALTAYWWTGNLNAADAKGVVLLAAVALIGGGQAVLSAFGLPFGASGGSTDSSFSDIFFSGDGDGGD